MHPRTAPERLAAQGRSPVHSNIRARGIVANFHDRICCAVGHHAHVQIASLLSTVFYMFCDSGYSDRNICGNLEVRLI